MMKTTNLVGVALLATNGLAAFNISALTSKNGYSTIECWQLLSLPIEARSAINYDIADTTKATWSIIEPQTVVGEAWAPTVQLTVVLNGLIHISAPAVHELNGYNETSASHPRVQGYFQPGTTISSVLVAADLNTTSYTAGHWTEFPSNEPTVLVQTPFVNNQVPEHIVLYDGPCV